MNEQIAKAKALARDTAYMLILASKADKELTRIIEQVAEMNESFSLGDDYKVFTQTAIKRCIDSIKYSLDDLRCCIDNL